MHRGWLLLLPAWLKGMPQFLFHSTLLALFTDQMPTKMHSVDESSEQPARLSQARDAMDAMQRWPQLEYKIRGGGGC